MKEFNMEEVLLYAKSSRNIEDILISTYRKCKFSFNKKGTKNRHLPLFNKTLYELIVELKRIPSVKEYETKYILKYSARAENNEPVKLHANNAYKSLLTDLHFYYILKESNLFDSVEISYIHDTAAKTDILLEKDGRTMGLQLFSGTKNDELSKKLSIKKLQINLGYELHLFPIKSKVGNRKTITTINNVKINLYSLEDALFLSNKIKEIKLIEEDELLEEELELDNFELLDEIELKQNTNNKSSYTHSVIFGGDFEKDRIQKLNNEGIKVYHLKTIKNGVTPFEIFNGVGYKEVKDYLIANENTCNGFNLYQFMVEHASPEEPIAINAGAGSGKTTTIVSRILYLLNIGAINSPAEVAMITFTNEAATNMENALTKELLKGYKLTGNERYHRFLQEIKKMKIATIPSFGKDILGQFGHYIGLGNSLKVSTLKIQREKIIEQYLDEVVTNSMINPFGNLKYHKAKKFISNLWDKFEQKGVVGKELEDYKKSMVEDNDLKAVIIKTIILAEEKFNEVKFDQDKLTVSDLTRYLKKLTEKTVPLEKLQNQMKYLFVDEFQDTDIAQIHFIASIASKAKLKLIVVGDVKQSIYRFRGANSTAFTVLYQYLKEFGYPKMREYGLFENFRSSRELIAEMEIHFSKWRKHMLLPQEDIPMYSRRLNDTGISNVLVKNNNSIDAKQILDRFNDLPIDSQNILAILVRTNEEAHQIGDVLKGIHNAPNFDVQMDGTLFMSDAARDILILIKSWIFPKSQDTLYSLSTTSFAWPLNEIKFKKIQSENETNKFYIGGEEYLFEVDSFWSEVRKLIKYKPLLAILNEFFSRNNYKENLIKRNYSETQIMKYELNLHKILMIIHEQFTNQSLDLITLYDWLKVQVTTNRDIDEAELEDSYFDGNFIKVMTVHKSKGLEFHTVMIPYTNSKFVKNEEYIRRDIIVQLNEKNQLDFGWKYIDNQSGFENETDNYSILKQGEDSEQLREETRLLYVAMTRAEKLLYIFDLENANPNTTSPNTWGDLLMM
jgi:superfamily I DNA/RNA helicase